MDAESESLEGRSHNLLQEIKKVGPDLKEVRLKLRKEWIPYWLGHTTEFRPTTKMPQFRLQPVTSRPSPRSSGRTRSQVRRSIINSPAMPHTANSSSNRADASLAIRSAKVRTLVGGTFSANLSRVGEKDNYDYLVRWVHNPRQRTRPYCPYEKRDLGPEDYAKHNLAVRLRRTAFALPERQSRNDRAAAHRDAQSAPVA